MTRKAELHIEKFENGITSSWTDPNNNEEWSRTVAIEGDEAKCIGTDMWIDIRDFLQCNSTNKVVIKIEYSTTE